MQYPLLKNVGKCIWPRKKKIKELEIMERAGVLRKITEPTEWVNRMGGKLRILPRSSIRQLKPPNRF